MDQTPEDGLISTRPRTPTENPGRSGQEGNRTTTRPTVRGRERERTCGGTSPYLTTRTLWMPDAMVGERISIAAEMAMAHLSINIRMCHASQKKEQWAVGKQSVPADIARARDFSRRMEDQIEMIQSTRGQVGGDRDAVLAVQYKPSPGLAKRPSPALSRGKGRSEDTAGACDVEPTSKRARKGNGGAGTTQSQYRDHQGPIHRADTPADARERKQTDPIRRSTTAVTRTRQMTKGEAHSARWTAASSRPSVK